MTTKRSLTMGLTGTAVPHNSQTYILFKISASGLFLKYSENFANFTLDILIKSILIKKKSVVQQEVTVWGAIQTVFARRLKF